MIFRNVGLAIHPPTLTLWCEGQGFEVKSKLIDLLFFGLSYLSMNSMKKKNSFLSIYLANSEREPGSKKDKLIGLKYKLHLFRWTHLEEHSILGLK